MDRFGSSRLRVAWTLASLLLAGLALGAIQGFGPDGTQLVVFGTAIPIGSDAPGIAVENLGRLIYTLVPAVLVLGGFLPMGEWLAAGSRGERFKGLFLGTALALAHGLFLSQVAMLPILASAFKFFGSPLGHAGTAGPWNRILQADLNGVLLGLQLLLWAGVLGLAMKSNRGLAVLGAYALASVGKILAWVGEWGSELELPAWGVKTAALLGHALPTESLPSDALAWSALPLAIGGPLALAALLLLLPGKPGRSAAKKARK
ncbi:MAG TPA: hypothetical protein PKM35_08910 [Holophaga sp.]|nr:hypothetical protein [Holophaga sp.]HPS67226.1 hypothetical protein [Holophaga sp.]